MPNLPPVQGVPLPETVRCGGWLAVRLCFGPIVADSLLIPAMTTIPTTTPAAATQDGVLAARAEGAVGMPMASPLLGAVIRREPLGLGALGLIVASLIGLYYLWVERQFGLSGFSARYFEDWGHAFAVPVISGIYVWINRHTIRWDRACVYWPGVAVLLLGVVMYAFFLLNIALANHMLQGFSMILAISGLVLLLTGPHVFRQTMFPIAFLGFAVTISEMIMNRITERLQDMAAVGSEVLLRMLLFDVTRLGNQLTVYNSAGVGYPLEVAEACSGMRMVVAFVALSVAVGFFSCRQWWHRVAVVLLAVPVAVFMNIVRVAVLAAITLVNPDFSVGGAHALIGTLLLVPAFLLFMFCVWLLKKITPDPIDTAKKMAQKKNQKKKVAKV